jgi:hypothetical protein
MKERFLIAKVFNYAFIIKEVKAVQRTSDEP